MKVLVCIIMLAALAGCGRAPDAPTVSRAPQATAAPLVLSSAVEGEAPALSSAVTLVRYERSGGLTGRTSSYTIRADGSVLVASPLTRGASTPLAAPDARTAADFAAQIAAVDVAALVPGDYAPKNACCDRISYSIDIVVGGREYSYSTVDGAANQPAALADLLTTVQNYIAAVVPAS